MYRKKKLKKITWKIIYHYNNKEKSTERTKEINKKRKLKKKENLFLYCLLNFTSCNKNSITKMFFFFFLSSFHSFFGCVLSGFSPSLCSFSFFLSSFRYFFRLCSSLALTLFFVLDIHFKVNFRKFLFFFFVHCFLFIPSYFPFSLVSVSFLVSVFFLSFALAITIPFFFRLLSFDSEQ